MDVVDNFTESDQDFDRIYPKKYQEISKIHWTPVDVIKVAVDWLNTKQVPSQILVLV